MKKEEFLSLELGRYEITDDLNIYKYELSVDSQDNRKIYFIKLKDSFSHAYICLQEDKSEEGNSHITILSKLGSFYVNSENSYEIIKKIEILNKIS